MDLAGFVPHNQYNMSKHGKKYLEAQKLIEKENYELDEAVELLKKTSTVNFDATCELHLKMGLDPKQADQNIRTSVSLPHGTGKDVRVAAFVPEDKIKEAKDAGASEAGTTELVDKIQKGWLEFDIAVATPDQMKDLAKVAKILGQKRLMPSPKSGTVTPEIAKVIGELKKGKIEIRIDKNSNLHLVFGKISFNDENLKENLLAIMKAVMDIKPSNSKGTYIKSMTITSSMGPGIALDANKVVTLV